MKVHHLNCGTMHPPGTPDGLVCHVLLLEAPTGLVLVDSGLGLRDAADPATRFGPARHFVRPVFDPAEAAVSRLTSLGHDPRDVRDIVLTHFDADHTGGIADFPWARVHLTSNEADAALHPRGFGERGRYLPSQRDHDPILVRHPVEEGEPWRGFTAVTDLGDVAPGLALISLPGHSRGHAAVAVDLGDRWILHAGDAFYRETQLRPGGRPPRTLTAMERFIAHDYRRVRANHERLAELLAASGPELLLINAHDPHLLRRARRVVPVAD
ncbi:MBL fold metallo-hydrolase [Nocardia takedensis]|uniref:MBL fold metallo-hydrolase n=1 Tax=Nocardia takedensis TaxID=259390 RepID=UPI00059427F2|nr:MBL fold metallo-hydrolase [Nocardia takedensis]